MMKNSFMYGRRLVFLTSLLGWSFLGIESSLFASPKLNSTHPAGEESDVPILTSPSSFVPTVNQPARNAAAMPIHREGSARSDVSDVNDGSEGSDANDPELGGPLLRRARSNQSAPLPDSRSADGEVVLPNKAPIVLKRTKSMPAPNNKVAEAAQNWINQLGPHHLGTLRVLIIDDSKFERIFSSKAATALGLGADASKGGRLDQAVSGEDAVRLVCGSGSQGAPGIHYDLIYCDYNMKAPGSNVSFNGDETTAALRACHSNALIVGFSDQLNPQEHALTKVKFMASGADDYHEKVQDIPTRVNVFGKYATQAIQRKREALGRHSTLNLEACDFAPTSLSVPEISNATLTEQVDVIMEPLHRF